MANAHAVATDILCLCQKDPEWEWVSGKTSESLQKVLFVNEASEQLNDDKHIFRILSCTAITTNH